MPDRDQPYEVWLAGNLRPVAGLAGVVAFLATAAIAGVGLARPPLWLAVTILGSVAILVAAVAALARSAARPRLARRGRAIEIRLAPTAIDSVPLDVVECLFRGSEPVARADGEARFRVGTLVVRFAERAAAFRERRTFRAWGTWEDGHAVIDGRWCEPLSAATVQRLAARLIEAKRQAAESRGHDG